MKKRNLSMLGVCVAVGIGLLIILSTKYTLHFGIASKQEQSEPQHNNPTTVASATIVTSSGVKPTAVTNENISPVIPDPLLDVPDPPTTASEFYTDVAQFDKHLDSLTDVDPQYVRGMRDMLEKRIRLNYPIAWPYKGDPDVMAYQNNGDMQSNLQLAGIQRSQFAEARNDIGMVDNDSRSKNNYRNCTVVVCDMSGKELAVMSRNGYFTPAQSPSMEANTKFYESEYPKQEPAMKRAVEISVVAYTLYLKYNAVGSLSTLNPQAAKPTATRIVDSLSKSKTLDKIPATFVHFDVTHGTVTLPNDFPMIEIGVERNEDGEWVCLELPAQVQTELARKSPYRQ